MTVVGCLGYYCLYLQRSKQTTVFARPALDVKKHWIFPVLKSRSFLRKNRPLLCFVQVDSSLSSGSWWLSKQDGVMFRECMRLFP